MISAYTYAGLTIPHKKQVIKLMHTSQLDRARGVIKIVCEHFNINPLDILNQCRKREFVMARQISIYFIKQKTKLTLKEIGNIFDGRDHATVIYSINTVNDLIDTDRKFAKTVTELEHLLLGLLKNIPENAGIPTVGSN